MDERLREIVVSTMELIIKRANALEDLYKDATIPDEKLYDELTRSCLAFGQYITYIDKRAGEIKIERLIAALRLKEPTAKQQPVEATDEERAAAMRAVEMQEPTGMPPMPLNMPGVK